ncbi:PTPRA-like protein [Mya arenaria]|uniref:PTPRA-like protein n=1 Tax=Mya arenaria TaxID=6604 RepID=A0ABY7DQH2_MYAAR|nr:PTPRA-like protein [Mya arenaria]
MGDYRHPAMSTVMVFIVSGQTVSTFVTALETKCVMVKQGSVTSVKDPGLDPHANDIAFKFSDPNSTRKAYGSRHLDNISPPMYSHLAHDGNYSTCSSTNNTSAGSGRKINPFWSIYFINNTRFNDFQLVLSDNKTLKAYFKGYKIYIENLTSWGYSDEEKIKVPLTTSRSLCYQQNGSKIANRTMVVQCENTLIGNSVRIEMANKNTQLVLCDIKISADGFPDTGFKIEVYNNSTSLFEKVFDNSTDVRPMTGIVLTSKGQYFKIRQMAGKQHLDMCEIQMFGYCPENYCGYNCSIPCNCRVPGSMKDRLTGVCTSGCAGRSTGRNGLCDHVCSNTTWGEECTYQCGHCNNGDSCNVSNGHCKTCAPGYKPTPKCEDECDLDKYGFNCSRNCGHCGLGLDCDKASGYCSAGCDAGWNGTLCDQECENGTYGSNCLETCGNCVAGCKKRTGTCLGGCLSGFKGETCKDIASSSGSVIAGSVVVVIVIAVGIVISVIFIRRRKAKPIKRRTAKSTYANGTEDDQSGINMVGENNVYINTTAVQQTSTAQDDHSRVVLQTETSYINACFIKGFQKTISYVASQGPMESNMEDFWQMIWEQNIQTVVMVTNLVEETKMKCLQYWGEGLKHKTAYGNFEVTLMKEEVFADFCIRTVGFHRTTHPSERRKLTQFHYTSWPDKDVPQSPISLIHFWRKGQYRLLHRLMLELFVLPFEPVRNELFDNTFREMSRVAHKSKSRKSRLRLQYEDLDKGLEMDSVDDDIACTNALLPDNYSKNRFDHILSADEYRPFLRSQGKGRNNYINAVFMPSYTNPKGFIISQLPLPSTAVDVCRLIIDEEINLVVQFDDSGKEEIGRFLPENEEKMKIDAFEVRRVRTYSGQDCQIQTVCLKLNHRTRTFKHILFKKWTRNRLVPPDSSSLLNLVKEVEGQQSPEDDWDSPILVLCLNGAERSGLFVVLMNILERCRVEGEVSIPQVIRYLRSRRKQIVPNLEQYVYCHNVTAKYLESSMTYANLQSAGSDA